MVVNVFQKYTKQLRVSYVNVPNNIMVLLSMLTQRVMSLLLIQY